MTTMGRSQRTRGLRRLHSFKPGRPNIVDQLRAGEQEIAELLPLTGEQAIPAAGTRPGKAWRSEAPRLRRRIVRLTNEHVYPGSVVRRALGLLRVFENRTAAQGHDRWWVTDKKRKDK